MPPPRTNKTAFNNYRSKVALAYVIAYFNNADNLLDAYAQIKAEDIRTPKQAIDRIHELIEENRATP